MKRYQLLIRAVTLTLMICLAGASQQAYSIGLGDINIQSQLGQPFKAQIKVFGANELNAKQLADPSCFRVNTNADNINQITKANLVLSNVTGNEATLIVSTSEIINEPISNLSVISDCGGNFRRDYVLLIDPPTSNESTASSEFISSLGETKTVLSKKVNATQSAKYKLETDSKNSVSQPKVNKSTSLKKNISNSKKNPNILLNVPDSGTVSHSLETKNTIANQKSNAPKGFKTAKPRLSISGDPKELTGFTKLQLRMDSHIDVNFKADPISLAADIEMQDELTVMNNRFANLEKQVLKLQQRNANLEADNKLKTKIIADHTAENNTFNLLTKIIFGAIALGGIYYVFSIWRKKQLLKAENAIASWESMEADNLSFESLKKYAHLAEDPFADSTIKAPLEVTNTIGFEKEYSQIIDTAVKKSSYEYGFFNINAERENQFVVEEQNNDATVLDHADVFLSHGRTNLAIQLLQNHLLEQPKQSVTIWLFLLDLLSKENMQSLYEQTALDCKEHFNIRIADFSKNEDTSIQTLEAYPRILEGLQQAWGKSAALVYLDDLIYNNRLELRTGLDKNLIEELLLLKVIAQENFNSAEVIQLDEKKVALKEQKEALLASKKAEKLQKIDDHLANEKEKKEESEKLFTFGLIE